MSRTIARAVLLLASVFTLPVVIYAQQFSGLTGVVTDKQGKTIPDVAVKLTNTQIGFSEETKTTELGSYLFVKVPPGTGYTLTFTKEGFTKLSVTDLSLGVGVTETRNASLDIGAISVTVEVKASGEASINTVDASIGNVIDPIKIASLPTLIRNSPAVMIGYSPGAVANTGGGTNRDGSITGARTDQGNITLDGMDVNDIATGQFGATVGNAPIDSLQEFRTVSAIPGAAEGTSGGAQIQLSTKSGTNNWHGALYEFNRNSLFAANGWFNNRSGIARPALNRNQFGGAVGGPIKKDKLFFFFNYEGRREASQDQNLRIVPLDFARNGGMAYVHSGLDTAGHACTSAARLNNPVTAVCITTMTPAQVASFDPKAVGADAALLTFLDSRYPHANDLTAGDGINTGGFRFNSPFTRADNTYVGRVDYTVTPKQKLFGRFNVVREQNIDDVNEPGQQFPGDPPNGFIQQRDITYVIGHTWTINQNAVNQLTAGVSKSVLNFPRPFRPTFPNGFTVGGGLTNPFPDFSSQSRQVPIPTYRDDLTLIRGNHTLQLGGSIKPEKSISTLLNDTNGVDIGLGGALANLTAAFRPNGSNPALPAILNNQAAFANYDSMYVTLLGRFADVNSTFNYNSAGKPLPLGTGSNRNFHYNNFEVYASDSWRATSSLTLTYGLQWSYFSVPFEVNGLQSVPSIDYLGIFSTRVANAAAGVADTPNVTYSLGGKANNARGYYEPDLANFGPRFGLAYNPSFKEGFLGHLFGDRKTVVRLGGSELFDRSATTLTFIADQVNYLFDQSTQTNFGNVNPTIALTNDPRFTSITSSPVTNTPPPTALVTTPFVDPATGIPFGTSISQNNYAMDPHYRTPREYTFGLGIQRELPGNFLFEADYVGRLGRRLFSEADVSQALNFKDLASGQMMFAAFSALQSQLQAGTSPSAVASQPWIENQVSAAIGTTCASAFGTTCTRELASLFTGSITRGSMLTVLRNLNIDGLINPNVGMTGQFFQNAYVTNLGSSNYNGLLLVLKRRLSQGLTFDLNYTYSHSIDNNSSVVNTVFGGQVCDLTNPRACRASSDFDARHVISGDYVYSLPFGRGRMVAGHAPGWLNQIIGGWEVSGLLNWRTGFPFSDAAGASPVTAGVGSPAILTGSASALQPSLHTAGTGAAATLQLFPDQAAAIAALGFPTPGQTGSRNTLRGLGYWNTDMAVLKNFKMPWGESQRVQFRWESFNLFNHPNFVEPNASLTSQSTFGVITAQRGTSRQMQFALRYDF